VINSRLVPDLVPDADGGYTIHVQHAAPDAARKPNWLPSPAGTFFLTLRTYLPGDAIRDGTWVAPPVRKLDVEVASERAAPRGAEAG
jgi:hypothetical protein